MKKYNKNNLQLERNTTLSNLKLKSFSDYNLSFQHYIPVLFVLTLNDTKSDHLPRKLDHFLLQCV